MAWCPTGLFIESLSEMIDNQQKSTMQPSSRYRLADTLWRCCGCDRGLQVLPAVWGSDPRGTGPRNDRSDLRRDIFDPEPQQGATGLPSTFTAHDRGRGKS
jgi:hypothetical protein